MPTARAEVVVTGLGVVSGWGWGVGAFEAALASGGTAIKPFSRFDHERYPTHVAAQVPERRAGGGRAADRTGQLTYADSFAIAAAREAVLGAGLPNDLSERDAGVFFASCTGGVFESELFYEAWRGRPFWRGPRRLLAAQPLSRPGEAVARALRVTGPVETVSSACASGTLAIGLALDALRTGSVDVAIAGGADSLARITFGGFNVLQAMDERPCMPFRAGRRGLSLGEGGAVLVLEREIEARRRGAPILAQLAGAGASADAHHMTAPEPQGRGAAAAISRALADAGCPPDAIDWVNAHGTGTVRNDLAEFRALEAVFGAHLEAMHVSATKGSVGHLLGSAGTIEAVATVLAIRNQRLQPVPGGGSLDPAIHVRLSRQSAPAVIRRALSLNLGFGGCNAALVIASPGSRPAASR